MGGIFGGGAAKKAATQEAARSAQQQQLFQTQQRESQSRFEAQSAEYARQSQAIAEQGRLQSLAAEAEKGKLLEDSKRAGGGFFGAKGTFLGGGSSARGTFLGG